MKTFKFIALAGALVAAQGSFASIKWIGADASTNADWSAAKNWEGGVAPTANDTASIAVDVYLRYLVLTPPLDFTGQISVGGESTDWDWHHPAQVYLNVLDGATWTVTGGGFVYATPNIAAHISSSFTGGIVIPKGYSFVAPSTLNSSVEFVGDGTLTVSTTTQLQHLTAFTGTLIWAGDATLSPEDTEYLQGHTWKLADGATIAFEKRVLTANAAVRIPDWNEDAAAWKMAGFNFATSAKHNLETNLPHANADGSLALVTDAAQIRSASFVGQKLKMCDSWSISFRCTPDMPTPSKYTQAGANQDMSGTFGVYFTTNTTCANGVRRVPVQTGGGFRVYQWCSKDYPNTLGWLRNYSGDGSNESGCYIRKTELDKIGSINFKKPIDFTVSFQGGLFTVQMRQGEKYLATFRKFNERYTVPSVHDGYYICLGASSDWWSNDNNVPWSTQTISDFKGWYRSREAGRWVDEGRSFYPFTTDNAVARQYWVADGATNTAENAFEEDGSFKLEEYSRKTRTVLMSQYYVKNTTPCLVTYDLVGGQGTGGENTEYTKVGFLRSNYEISNWQYSYVHLGEQNIDSWSAPLMIKTYWYGDGIDGRRWAWSKVRCAYRSGGAVETESAKLCYMPTMYKNRTQHAMMLCDGSAGLYYQMCPSSMIDYPNWAGMANFHWSPAATHRSSWAYGQNMRLVFEHYSSWGRVDTWLKNVKVKVLKDNQSGYISSELAVEANATATFKADAQFPASATETAELAGVTLADGSTFKVATDVSGSKILVDKVTVVGSDAKLEADTATVVKGNVEYTGSLPAKALSVTGSATFSGDTLTFVVPEAWRKLRCGTVTLLDASSLAADAVPPDVRIVTDAGFDMTSRAEITTTGGLVKANWTRGGMVILR